MYRSFQKFRMQGTCTVGMLAKYYVRTLQTSLSDSLQTCNNGSGSCPSSSACEPVATSIVRLCVVIVY